jgi:hypothetical protein
MNLRVAKRTREDPFLCEEGDRVRINEPDNPSHGRYSTIEKMDCVDHYGEEEFEMVIGCYHLMDEPPGDLGTAGKKWWTECTQLQWLERPSDPIET